MVDQDWTGSYRFPRTEDPNALADRIELECYRVWAKLPAPKKNYIEWWVSEVRPAMLGLLGLGVKHD